jgi:LmbE family N-acetylglucosaminyl deacetylase
MTRRSSQSGHRCRSIQHALKSPDTQASGFHERSRLSLPALGPLPKPLHDAPLLLLSPHFDDAALSCAALISRKKPIDVLTVFAGEPAPPRQGKWDRVAGFVDSAESRRVRQAEERAAFGTTPHRLDFLDLLELEYLIGPRTRADAESIALAASRWLENNPGGVVALPAGAGRSPGLITRAQRLIGMRKPLRHEDHVFVRDSALDAVASQADAHAVLYEDFPYLWGEAADKEVRRVTRSRGLSAECVVVQVDRPSKATRIAAYASQAPHLSVRGRRVDVADNLPEEERYWILQSKTAR